MSSGATPEEWHYLVGLEVRGPVTLEQLSNLITAGTLAETVLVSSKDSARWRPAKEVFDQLPATWRLEQPLSPSPLNNHPSAFQSAGSRSLFGQIGDTLNQVAGTEKLESFSLHEMFSDTFQRR